MSNLLNYLEMQEDKIVNDLYKVVKAESPSKNKKLTDLCGEIIQEIVTQRVGGEIEVFPQENRGDHFKFTIGKGKQKVLICGHYDTVWEKGSLPIKIENAKFYGPGVFDMKGGLIQSIWAIHTLLKKREFPNIELTFLFTSDEEIGSQTSRELIEQEALNSDVVLIPESPVEQTGEVKTARKGVGIYQLEIFGKATHAGNSHESGRNAVTELAHQIIHLENLTNYEIGTTVNVGVIKGGTKTNVVPDYATAMIDFRVETVEEATRMVNKMQSLKPISKGVEIKLTGGLNRPPMVKTDKTEALFKKVKTAGELVGLQIEEKLAGGGSDGNFTAMLGIPTIDGLGVVGGGAHAKNEHIVLDELPKRVAMFAELLKLIGGR